MSGIFGLIHPGGQTVSRDLLDQMRASMAHWGPDGTAMWHDQACGLGHCLLYNTPESIHERLPYWQDDCRLAITAEARLDNRDELCDYFAIPHPERLTTPDSVLILQAFLRWGEACPDYLLGDWSFAIWNPEERKLFLARDHHGNTSLCYWQTEQSFAFASDPQALYAIGAPRRLNELFLAQLLTSWPAYHGPQTIDLDIQRLPPAHAMTITPRGTRVWRYWTLEETPELHLRHRDDYVQGFLEVYDAAVRCRLRSHRPVGVTLSGGLDSGSVTVLAASALAHQGHRLTAFTAVPRYDSSKSVGPRWFGDETRYATATASCFGNIDHCFLDSAGMTPMNGIGHTLAVMREPSHAASNHFWITDLLDQARSRGVGTLLTGQGGNATVSWTGAPHLRSTWAALRYKGWKSGVRQALPFWLLRQVRRCQALDNWSASAIHPDFAHRIGLKALRIEAIGKDLSLADSRRKPSDLRHAIIQPGNARVGDLWARWGAGSNLEIRDPTFDKRVMSYTLSVPDSVWDAPEGGGDRWLMRQAMVGLLPDEVRLNSNRGRQSADLAGRLLASAGEVDASLAAVDAAPANEYLDLGKMRQAWHDVQQEASPMHTHRAGSILLRGLMAGLFLNRT